MYTVTTERLAKRYELGETEHFTTLQETLMNWTKGVFQTRRTPKAEIWALNEVSLQIGQGEVVGIIGRNGAGKSTLLKILSRITRPTSGTFKVRGRVASLLEVGTGFHEELTGRENVFLNGSILGMKKKEIQARLDQIVDFAGVEMFMDTPIKRYSSGMRLRLGFAVAAHLDPDVLIIDEVLAVGDMSFQKKCLGAMQELRSGGRTVLFVSHNLAAVENLCSRAIWIDAGKVRMDGDSKSVIQAYMATFAEKNRTGSDLGTIKERRGTGEIRYTGIEFLNSDRQQQLVTRSGDRLVIRLHYRAFKPIRYPSFGFRIFTEMGTLVSELGHWQHGIAIPQVPVGTGYVEIELDSVNLLPGRYNLSLWLTGSHSSQTIYDGLEHCVTLEIENSDLYGAGRTFGSRYGIVFFPQRWKLDGLLRTTSVPAEDSELVTIPFADKQNEPS